VHRNVKVASWWFWEGFVEVIVKEFMAEALCGIGETEEVLSDMEGSALVGEDFVIDVQSHLRSIEGNNTLSPRNVTGLNG